MTGAFRVSRPMAAALAATLRLTRNHGEARRTIPLLQLATASVENLQNRAERLAAQIAAVEVVESAEPKQTISQLRDATGLGLELPSWGVLVKPSGMSAEQLAAALRTVEPVVVGRIERECLVLDLRAVPPRQDVSLVDAFSNINGK